MQNEKLKTTNNKWLLWGLIGFTGILLVTAIILFLQLKKPTAPLPPPKPKASPTLPTVKQTQPENVCELTFSVRPKYCLSTSIDLNNLSPGEKAVFSSVSNTSINFFTYALYNRDNEYSPGNPKPICVTQGGDNSDQDDCPAGTHHLIFQDPNSSSRTSGFRTVNYEDIFVIDKNNDFGRVSNIQVNAYFMIQGGQISLPEPNCVAYIASVEASPSPSPEPTACFDTCDNDSQCQTDLRCMTVGGDKRCVNPDCSEETDCSCAEAKMACYDKCQNDNDCASGRRCMTIPNTNDKRCVNSDCISENDCSCEQALVSPSPSPSTTTVIVYASPSPPPPAGRLTKGGQPELPEAGIVGPAVLGVSAGLLMIILGLLF